MKKLIPALLSLLLLAGCRTLQEPTDMFVIAGAALDWDGTRYRLANEMGDTGSTKDDLPRSRVFTGTGQTVSACLFDMASRAEREIYFGKTEVLMLQETMPADKRCQALELFLDHRSDHQVLLCALRADSPEAALSFGEQAQLRTGVVMGLLKDGARRVYCRTVQAEDVPDRGAYMLPEITVDDRGAVLSGAALYVDHKYRGRLEGQPVRLLCLLLGSEVESACSFHGPDWAVWLKDARTDRSGTTLQLTLEPAFWEGTPDRQEAEAYLSQMGDALLAELKRLRCDLLALPDFFDTEYRVAVTVNTP